MRIKYNMYSYKHGDMSYESDLGSWIRCNLGHGIEEQLRAMKDLVILCAEDMLSRNPEKIDDIVRILCPSGTDYKVEHDQADD
jgi:benzoyl-CoA reductase/2-hydroxyglutaryl-CoA dehydratase subunit BcrC/BadD/HgdB